MENKIQTPQEKLNTYFRLAKKSGLVQTKEEFADLIHADKSIISLALDGQDEFIEDLCKRACDVLIERGAIKVEDNGNIKLFLM